MYFNLEDHGDACYSVRGRMYVRRHLHPTCPLTVRETKRAGDLKNIANEERMKEMEA